MWFHLEKGEILFILNAHASKLNSIVKKKKKLKIKQIDITFLAKGMVLVLVQGKTRPLKRLMLTGPNNKNKGKKICAFGLCSLMFLMGMNAKLWLIQIQRVRCHYSYAYVEDANKNHSLPIFFP